MLFAAVLQMSLTGGFVCLAVCALRLLLRRAPKAFSYGLWALVFLRFACPVAPGSAASVIPRWEAPGRQRTAIPRIPGRRPGAQRGRARRPGG